MRMVFQIVVGRQVRRGKGVNPETNIDNQPGIISRIAQKLYRADINIEYAYCTATKNQEFGCVVIKTKDAELTLEILEEEG